MESAAATGEPFGRLDDDMFHGPRRLAAVEALLRRVPFPLAAAVLAGLAVADGVVRGGRFRHASTWAAAQGARGWRRRRLAAAILANHGRFVADEMLVGGARAETIARGDRLEIVGEERLNAVAGGAILLGFHLGAPRTWLLLRARGYPVRFAGRLERATRDARWQSPMAAREVVRLPAGSPEARVPALYRLRNLLREGALVYVTADGTFGREAFRIDLPGGPLVVRAGWLALRRTTGVPTLPVLMHRDGARRVIVIHPPLPAPDANAPEDVAACRAALAPIVADYVRRFPTQCRWLAVPRSRARVERREPDRADAGTAGAPSVSPSVSNGVGRNVREPTASDDGAADRADDRGGARRHDDNHE